MLTLFCALVREEQGNAFPVDIEPSKTVDDLKKAIRDKKPNTITDDAEKLELFLAKKDNAWMTENEVKQLTEDEVKWLTEYKVKRDEMKQEDGNANLFKPLDLVSAPLNLIGLSDVPALTTEDVIAKRILVHVLVVVPKDPVVPLSIPLAMPNGPEVDLRSCCHLLAFLEGEMTNKVAIVSRPHILAQESLEFRLVGREQAIETASKCFKNIIRHANSTACDRNQVAMPVCSGISGLGKTRMLEEGTTILQVMKLNPEHVFRVIVPYFNGFSPQSVERSMPIEASFSWRLLYRFFLDMNCDLSFSKWFESRIPRNGAQLTLECAVEVIERKLRDKLQVTAPLYLFLGIDEYQKIEKIGALRKDPNTSLLHELVETIGALLCLQSASLVLLPMFAGTDLGVIESSLIENSSYYVTERLPMYLLSMNQVFSIVQSNASYAGLLNHVQICRHLFILGGVPRWIVEYLTALKNTCVQGEPVKLDNINKCFVAVWTKYVEYYLRSLKTPQLVRLAAFAVSGQPVVPHGTFDGNLMWSRLRDSSLCLLIPRTSSTSGKYDVRVPYALLGNIGSRSDEMTTEAEKNFASALKDMREEVDSTMFKLQLWQSWEMFGAYFYAVRINALLALGYSTVTLRDLLPGTLMSDETSGISVNLVPSRVIRCAGAFGASTPPRIPLKANELETIDWTLGGFIVLNEVGGEAVDIFFSLKDATTGSVVVFVDQRKRQFGKFQPSHARAYLSKLSVCPSFLVARGARLVRGVMNCVLPSNLATYVVPDDCFILSRAETKQFHGTLTYHPACSPVISINSACKTALKTVFQGDAKEVDQVVGEILRKRKEQSGGFRTSDELLQFINAKRLKVQVDDQFAEFSF